MIRIENAIVHNGQLVLKSLPFSDGQQVRVEIEEQLTDAEQRAKIDEVKAKLAGSVIRMPEPEEPLIPLEDWEMLK